MFIAAEEIIPITRFGAVPNSHKNIMPAIKLAFTYCNGKSNVKILFPKGRYDFWPIKRMKQTKIVGFNVKKLNV